MEALARFGLSILISQNLVCGSDVTGLVVNYVVDDRPMYKLERSADDTRSDFCPQCDWTVVHTERRSTTWNIQEMTSILLHFDVAEEVEHQAWIEILSPIDVLGAEEQEQRFPRYFAFSKEFENNMDISVKPFVDPEEVAQVCKSVDELFVKFTHHVYRDRYLRVTKEPMITF